MNNECNRSFIVSLSLPFPSNTRRRVHTHTDTQHFAHLCLSHITSFPLPTPGIYTQHEALARRGCGASVGACGKESPQQIKDLLAVCPHHQTPPLATSRLKSASKALQEAVILMPARWVSTESVCSHSLVIKLLSAAIQSAVCKGGWVMERRRCSWLRCDAHRGREAATSVSPVGRSKGLMTRRCEGDDKWKHLPSPSWLSGNTTDITTATVTSLPECSL